jgi:hypothetical protein
MKLLLLQQAALTLSKQRACCGCLEGFWCCAECRVHVQHTLLPLWESTWTFEVSGVVVGGVRGEHGSIVQLHPGGHMTS